MKIDEEKLKKLQPFLSKAQWDVLRWRYILAKDSRQRLAVERLIEILLAKFISGLQQDQIILPPPGPEYLAGTYQVGRVLYGSRFGGIFGIRENEWIRHCGIFGKTGSGKTTLAMNLLSELSRSGHPFLIFDYKRNYRDLLNHPDFKNEEILVFTVGREVSPFYFNPKIPPPGVEEYVWQKQLAEIIEKVYLLGPGANDVFMEASEADTFAEMKEKVLRQHKKARELLWWASVKRTLNAINYPGLGEMVNCQQGFSIPELLQKRVILELDGLSASDQGFVIGSLLLWIYHYRMRQTEREQLKHVILIEEAHHLFLRTRREEDIADVIMREIRELGEAMIIIDQHPCKMSISALGNLATKFCLSLSLNQDVKAVSDAMLLERSQQRYLSMLRVGESICRTDRLTQPILLEIPLFRLDKGLIRDEQIKRHMQPYLADLGLNKSQPKQPGSVQGIRKLETLSPLGRILLESMALEPYLGVVQRLKKLGLKTAEGYKLLHELESSGLIQAHTIDGRKLHSLTMAGRNMLGGKVARQGRGGLEHGYWVHRLQTCYQKRAGFRVFLERGDIDLVIEGKPGRLAIQLETGKSNLENSFWKLGRFEAEYRFILATNRGAELKLKRLQRELLSPGIESIRVQHVKSFLDKPVLL